MPKAEVLAPISKVFERRVQQLAKDSSDIVQAYAHLTHKMLSFAASFKETADQARKLDKADDGVHAQYLRNTLADAIDTANGSIWSRWTTIGTYAPALLKYADSLPPQRDSLYELALAAKDRKPIEKWIEREVISADSSVRDLRALRKPSKAKKSRSSPRRHLNAQITLCFKTYADAYDALSDVIMKNKNIEIIAHQAFAETFKEKVGIDGFAKIEHRFR